MDKQTAFVAEYKCTSWECDEYQVIGVCATLESAQATIRDYLRLDFTFKPEPKSLIYAPQLRAWKAQNVERSYKVRIYETALIGAAAPTASEEQQS